MRLIYSKETGEIKMRCEDEIDYDKTIFSEKIINLTEQEQDKLEQNWKSKIIKDSLIFEKSENIIEKEKLIKKETLREDIANAKTIDEIKQILLEIL